MISVALFAFVLLSASSGNPIVKDEPVDTAEKLIHCVHIALDTGLPAADLPPHNPLVIQENLTYSIDIPTLTEVITLTVSLPHAQIDGILDYNFTQLEGQMVTDDDGIESAVLNYTIYWPDMNLNGDWLLNFGDDVANGTIDIHLKHVTFAGIWDMVISGQDVPRQMNDVTVDLVVGDVEAKISNIPFEGLTEALIEDTILILLNSIPTETTSEFLKYRLDTFWFGHPERIDAIIDNCKNNGKY